jgi:hypothetical protein
VIVSLPTCQKKQTNPGAAAAIASAIVHVAGAGCVTLNRLDGASTSGRTLPPELYAGVVDAVERSGRCVHTTALVISRVPTTAAAAPEPVVTVWQPELGRGVATVRIELLRRTRPGEYPIEGAEDQTGFVAPSYRVQLTAAGGSWKVRKVDLGRP